MSGLFLQACVCKLLHTAVTQDHVARVFVQGRRPADGHIRRQVQEARAERDTIGRQVAITCLERLWQRIGRICPYEVTDLDVAQHGKNQRGQAGSGL